MVNFIPTIKRTSAEGLAQLFRDNVWKLHRLPKSIILDWEPQFVAGVMQELNKMLGIESKLSMAFHPQTDRQTEYHNLAKQLSYYLYFFSFSFLLDLLYIRSAGKCHITRCYIVMSHKWMSQCHIT